MLWFFILLICNVLYIINLMQGSATRGPRANLRPLSIFLFLIGCGPQKNYSVAPERVDLWPTKKLYFKLIFFVEVLYFDLFHFKSQIKSIQLILPLKH